MQKIIFRCDIQTPKKKYIAGETYNLSEKDYNDLIEFADVQKMKDNNFDYQEALQEVEKIYE